MRGGGLLMSTEPLGEEPGYGCFSEDGGERQGLG